MSRLMLKVVVKEMVDNVYRPRNRALAKLVFGRDLAPYWGPLILTESRSTDILTIQKRIDAGKQLIVGAVL